MAQHNRNNWHHIPGIGGIMATGLSTETDLPEDWQEFPHPFSTQNIGREFVTENEFCVLIIPSVVTHGDYNVLINPNHIDFSKIKITSMDKFPFDKRIFN